MGTWYGSVEAQTMTAVYRTGLTLDEFLELPEEKPALEYFEGEVTQKASPMLRHGRLQFTIPALINAFAGPRRLALAFPEVRGTYANASRVPDVAVYCWSRIPRTPDGEVDNDQFIPPDIVIEISSPKQSIRKLSEKCRWYVGNGVEIALLIDDRRKSVTRFGNDGSERRLTGADRIDLDSVLPGFELTAEALFRTLHID